MPGGGLGGMAHNFRWLLVRPWLWPFAICEFVEGYRAWKRNQERLKRT